MAREPISDATYEPWRDIVYQLYFKARYSRSTILEWFKPSLTQWTLTQVAARYAKEHPDDEYVIAKRNQRS